MSLQPQSLQRRRSRPCSQMLPPPQSLHTPRTRPCLQMPLPLQSLHWVRCALTLISVRFYLLGLFFQWEFIFVRHYVRMWFTGCFFAFGLLRTPLRAHASPSGGGGRWMMESAAVLTFNYTTDPVLVSQGLR
jgi:hypothetical protein